jgi:hypothetical protein
MRTGPIPITFAVVFLLLAGACGGTSDEEVREAQTSGYKGDFAVIYSETLAAVRELYPHVNEDARVGIVRTAWHPVHVQQGADDSTQSATVNPRGGRTGFQSAALMREQFFIRFTVHVVGGRPWRVRVYGEASAWKAGEMPTPLRGSEIPQWLAGRVNALEVAIFRRLKGHAVELKYAPVAATTAAAAAPVDMAKFGQVPAEAARVIAAVEQAAGARDVAALRKLMADQFTYTTGDEPSADTAIVVWQADPSILAELDKVLDAGCAHDAGRKEVVCPAAFLDDPGQAGYRAGFRQVEDGSWRIVSFTGE